MSASRPEPPDTVQPDTVQPGTETPGIEIAAPGWGTTIQDRGRPGLADLGVPTAGAVDPSGQALANRLVGNPERLAVFETAGGLVVRALRPVIVADTSTGWRAALAAGERLAVAAGADRARSGSAPWAYLAVRGGLRVDPVLGSASHDTLSGLGPPPVVAGARYALGPDPGSDLVADLAPPRAASGAVGAVAVWPGPQVDRFVGGLAALTERPWTVAGEVGRVGARFVAQHVERVAAGATDAGATDDGASDDGAVGDDTADDVMDDRTMPSAGLVPGAIQITPAGEPIVMLCNHPTTGGYPVIAVVDPDDLSIVAQSPPGAVLRFRPR